MKKITKHVVLLAGALILAAVPPSLQASPYASGITVNAGTVSFYLNESGGNVTVVYEDGTTNASWDGFTTGTNVSAGQQSFSLNGHNGYSIIVGKVGNGIPSLISVDTNLYNCWPSPRGVDVNKNPKIGAWFGRTYIGNSAPGLAYSGAPFAYLGTPAINLSLKGRGLWVLNPDLTVALGIGTNGVANAIFAAGGNDPWKMRVAPDGSVIVNCFQAVSNSVWQFSPDLTTSNLLLTGIGTASTNHGQMFDPPLVTGSLAAGNMVIWTADGTLGCPSTTTRGPGTSVGSFNCLYRYDVGSGPLPWGALPNYGYTVGLDGIANLRPEVDLGTDGKIIAGFGRANLSNPDVQILDPTGTTYLWDSWHDTGGATDPWNGINTGGGQLGTYAGLRVSPDGRFLASVDQGNGITMANLTNGIPDDGTIFAVPQPVTGFTNGIFPATGTNAPYTTSARGMCWDAANNLLVASSGQGLLRAFSLGITETCITTNDASGTNGAFRVILPAASATVVATTPTASQNHGSPTAGVFTITLNESTLALPVTVSFTLNGTAAYLTNYLISNPGTDGSGIIVNSNKATLSVTFPVGTAPSGNWTKDVQILPTATPVSGPTLTAIMKVLGGGNNVAGSPNSATVSILNTGPQVLVLSAAAIGTNMSRSISGDYAKFIITRTGDLGAGSYTVTNFSLLGTAVFPGDYTAGAQRFAGSTLSDGPGSITINPGDVTITNAIGNPVAHVNLNQAPQTVSVILSLTNSVTGIANTSAEGVAYTVSTNSVTMLELDNVVGPEVVLWSNPLTNAADNGWTLTFANTALNPTTTVLPVVIPNYTNDETALSNGGTNDFRVEFGKGTMDDNVPPSPVMLANGWTNALRMTVNKDGSDAAAGVNIYPQGQVFHGNYALRFSMYLSILHSAINNPSIGTFDREFAAFGINHSGTNCIWRLATPLLAGTGNSTTNADGVWFALDAGDNSVTPADFDAFTSPVLPNPGVSADYVSSPGSANAGTFKNPPFTTEKPAGGEPVNQWVDVSVEVTMGTNVNFYIDRAPVLTSFMLTNGGGNYISGEPMLGYLDPVADVSSGTAFAYYSNVRVVELSPYITAPPVSLLATQGANVSFTSSAAYATAPVTNTWYLGSSPGAALQTDTANATNLTSTLSLSNVQFGTNYISVFSDVAGSVTGQVANLEVIIPATNRVVNAGSNVVFAVIANGPSAPTWQWQTNGVNLANNSHFAGVTTGTLIITNAQLRDATTYSVAVSNGISGFILNVTLTVNATPPTFSSMSISGANALLHFTTSNPFDTTAGFTLQSCGVVTGPYTNAPGTITGPAGGPFLFTVPYNITNSSLFYRLIHN